MNQKIVIRTSDRLNFKRCRQHWDFGSKIRQDWEPLFGPLNLDFGIAIHAALHVYYEPDFWHADRSIVQLAAIEEFRSHCYDRRARYLLSTGQEDIDPEIERTQFIEPLQLGVGMLQHYFTYAPSVDNFTPIRAEIEFEVPIPAANGFKLPLGFAQLKDGNLYVYDFESEDFLPVVYQGRCDLLLEDRFNRYWIMDHKTAGQFGSVEYLEMDEQCGSYIWALRKMLGLPIAGVIYNRLLKDVPKPPKELMYGGFSKNRQQRTTYELYKQTLIDNGERLTDYIEFLEFLQDKPNPFFQRYQVSRSDTEMQNLERQIGIEAIDMLNNPSIYPNVGMFTCMGCAYRTPCLAKMDGSDYEFILKNQFRKRTDEPREVEIVSGT